MIRAHKRGSEEDHKQVEDVANRLIINDDVPLLIRCQALRIPDCSKAIA
jgi:hypothetical protein